MLPLSGRIMSVLVARLCIGAAIASQLLPSFGQSNGHRTFPGAEWQEKTPEEMGVAAPKLEAFKKNICGIAPEHSGGCVIKDGCLIFSWGNFKTRQDWASAAKPVLSTMLFAAIAERKVKDPDSPILPWWPALRINDQTMTFRHLADMTSGYACADKDQDGKPRAPGSRWAYNDYAIMLYARTLDKVFGGDGGMSSGSLD